jgi:hypothetical protein
VLLGYDLLDTVCAESMRASRDDRVSHCVDADRAVFLRVNADLEEILQGSSIGRVHDIDCFVLLQ